MQPSSLLFVSDRSMGSINLSALSDQTLMELFVEELDDASKEQFKLSNGDYLLACDWKGVKCIKNRVSEIFFNIHDKYAMKPMHGTLSFSALPRSIKSCEIRMIGYPFYGSIDTTTLPAMLLNFSVRENFLTGYFELRHLPPQLKKLNINENEFTGSCYLSALPSELEEIHGTRNKFHGSIELDKLPRTLRVLNFCGNSLQGSLDLTKLPSRMKAIYLNDNNLCGEVFFDKLPRSISELQLRKNKLFGSIRFSDPPGSLESVCLVDNNFSGTAIIPSHFRNNFELYGNKVSALAEKHAFTDRLTVYEWLKCV